MEAWLPHSNALFNAAAFVCLLLGYRAIRRREVRRHRAWMLAAVTFSGLFLSSYTLYHYLHGPVAYRGRFPGIYYPLLLTHTPLALLVVPLVLLALYFAHRGAFHRHRALTRWLWPLWAYVSVSGVAIYLLLYHLP